MINPAKYWRQSKDISLFLGQRGEVMLATYIRAAGSNQHLQAPYSFVLVKLAGGKKVEMVGVGHDKLQPGDKIECVLRKTPSDDSVGLIEYVIKAKKV
ncbi:MAG: hypothetical protein XD95_0241 [Microgenomates bacterium 39_7]|nr:MAG: hypothetical protein XD95_0241 [Microgenomates bacterium 39_7]